MVVVKVRDKEVEMSQAEALERQRGALIGQKRPVNEFKRFALDIG